MTCVRHVFFFVLVCFFVCSQTFLGVDLIQWLSVRGKTGSRHMFAAGIFGGLEYVQRDLPVFILLGVAVSSDTQIRDFAPISNGT